MVKKIIDIDYDLIKFYLENEKKLDAIEEIKDAANIPAIIQPIIKNKETEKLFSLIDNINNNRKCLMENLAETLKEKFPQIKIQRGRKNRGLYYLKLSKCRYKHNINFEIFLLGNSFDIEPVKDKKTICWIELYIFLEKNNKKWINKYNGELKNYYKPSCYIYNKKQFEKFEELNDKVLLVRIFPISEFNDKMFDKCIESIDTYLNVLK